jgi:hypothetical protein
MFFKKDRCPVVVEVRDGRWECYGHDTMRARWLYKIIKTQGISDQTPEGLYHFNAIRKGFKLELTLEPVE